MSLVRPNLGVAKTFECRECGLKIDRDAHGARSKRPPITGGDGGRLLGSIVTTNGFEDSTMKGSSVSQKLKRNVRENNCIFTLKQRRSVRCSQERVVLYTMLDESQRDVRLDAVVE